MSQIFSRLRSNKYLHSSDSGREQSRLLLGKKPRDGSITGFKFKNQILSLESASCDLQALRESLLLSNKEAHQLRSQNRRLRDMVRSLAQSIQDLEGRLAIRIT